MYINENNESNVYYSAYTAAHSSGSDTLSPTSFTGTGSGAITISDKIVGIKGFRQDLFIFCENRIFLIYFCY